MEETSFQFICPMSPTVCDCATFPPLLAEKTTASQPTLKKVTFRAGSHGSHGWRLR